MSSSFSSSPAANQRTIADSENRTRFLLEMRDDFTSGHAEARCAARRNVVERKGIEPSTSRVRF